LRLVDSIHALLTEVESERGRAGQALEVAKGKIAGLASAKTELETQLASTTQRLEFAVAQADSAKAGAARAASAAAAAAAGGGAVVVRRAEEEEVDVDGLLTSFLGLLWPFGRRRPPPPSASG